MIVPPSEFSFIPESDPLPQQPRNFTPEYFSRPPEAVNQPNQQLQQQFYQPNQMPAVSPSTPMMMTQPQEYQHQQMFASQQLPQMQFQNTNFPPMFPPSYRPPGMGVTPANVSRIQVNYRSLNRIAGISDIPIQPIMNPPPQTHQSHYQSQQPQFQSTKSSAFSRPASQMSSHRPPPPPTPIPEPALTPIEQFNKERDEERERLARERAIELQSDKLRHSVEFLKKKKQDREKANPEPKKETVIRTARDHFSTILR
eukprot:c46288_g1_i1.p1 GENE.c46288_g1_i1~~c46288_g1_i1.p1  ORF type:complete len:275 (+),score=54.65 c46288_g1_i1:59-826(+)